MPKGLPLVACIAEKRTKRQVESPVREMLTLRSWTAPLTDGMDGASFSYEVVPWQSHVQFRLPGVPFISLSEGLERFEAVGQVRLSEAPLLVICVCSTVRTYPILSKPTQLRRVQEMDQGGVYVSLGNTTDTSFRVFDLRLQFAYVFRSASGDVTNRCGDALF